MTKEEKIKNEYGEDFERCNPSFTNGWSKTVFIKNINKEKYDELDSGYFGYLKLRPKSLQGIENNNGWVRIESEADLPKESGEYFFFSRITNSSVINYFITDSKVEMLNKKILSQYSHYRPISRPEPPIY